MFKPGPTFQVHNTWFTFHVVRIILKVLSCEMHKSALHWGLCIWWESFYCILLCCVGPCISRNDLLTWTYLSINLNFHQFCKFMVTVHYIQLVFLQSWTLFVILAMKTEHSISRTGSVSILWQRHSWEGNLPSYHLRMEVYVFFFF